MEMSFVMIEETMVDGDKGGGVSCSVCGVNVVSLGGTGSFGFGNRQRRRKAASSPGLLFQGYERVE